MCHQRIVIERHVAISPERQNGTERTEVYIKNAMFFRAQCSLALYEFSNKSHRLTKLTSNKLCFD